MVFLQALVIGLTALILTPGYSFYFDVTPKLVFLLAGAAFLLAWSAIRFRAAPRSFSIVILLTLTSLATSAAASGHPSLSVYGTIWRRFGALPQAVLLVFAWMVAAQTAGRPDRVRTILRGVAISGALSASYGICQYAGWDPFLNPTRYHIGEGIWTIVRPPGTLGYVSYFASWLLMVVFLSIALASLEESRWWRRFAFFAAALSLAAMALTGTRAALAGLAAGAVVGLYARGKFRISRRVVTLAAVAVIAGTVFWFTPAGWNLRSRARWVAEDPWGGARPLLWRDSLRMGFRHPVLGFGPETFQGAFPHYESAALARAYPDFTHESPHNMFLDALIAQGLPGLVCLMLLCLLGLRRSHPWLTAAVAAAIVCQQFTVFNLPTALVFYVSIALAVAMISPEAERRRIGVPAMAVVASAVCLLYLAIRFGAADRQLTLTRRALDGADFSVASGHYAAYEALQPGETSADLWYSRALLDTAGRATNPPVRMRALMLAEPAALRSTETAEDPFNAWFNLAILRASQDNIPATEKALESAIAACPRWFKPHWTLAQLLRAESRYEEAEREAVLAVYLDGDKHIEVLHTLRVIRAMHAAAPASGSQK
jgi:O-antigen ligase